MSAHKSFTIFVTPKNRHEAPFSSRNNFFVILPLKTLFADERGYFTNHSNKKHMLLKAYCLLLSAVTVWAFVDEFTVNATSALLRMLILIRGLFYYQTFESWPILVQYLFQALHLGGAIVCMMRSCVLAEASTNEVGAIVSNLYKLKCRTKDKFLRADVKRFLRIIETQPPRFRLCDILPLNKKYFEKGIKRKGKHIPWEFFINRKKNSHLTGNQTRISRLRAKGSHTLSATFQDLRRVAPKGKERRKKK
ncbi:hypothetical protein EVAR_44653_1 [Eumeta japonica]|uniref:Uncharacterized protein n=1 Tax=Eumeta variegata TaxID=151549 RepID=A0A4C1XJ69_EUMVA|nr:hypothetical protein EVAR_44653_1 [Eumeta japonica]